MKMTAPDRIEEDPLQEEQQATFRDSPGSKLPLQNTTPVVVAKKSISIPETTVKEEKVAAAAVQKEEVKVSKKSKKPKSKTNVEQVIVEEPKPIITTIVQAVAEDDWNVVISDKIRK